MRILSILIAALLLVGCLSSCIAQSDNDDTYTRLNEMLALKAKELQLVITAGEGEDALNGKYTVTNGEADTAIRYSYEEFTTFSVENGSFVIPNAHKQTLEGSMTVADEKILTLDGAPSDLPIRTVTLSRLRLSEAALTNAVLTDTSLTADVADANALFGFTDTHTQMQLALSFTAEHISTLRLSYLTQAGTPVVMEYTFTY